MSSLSMTNASRTEGGGPSKAFHHCASNEPATQHQKRLLAAFRQMSRFEQIPLKKSFDFEFRCELWR